MVTSTVVRLVSKPAHRYTVWVAIPINTQRIAIFGSNPGGEIWETGFWLLGGLPTSAGAANEQANDIWDTCLSESDPPLFPFMQTSMLNAQGNIRGVRVYVYTNGGPRANFVGEYTAPAPLAGSSNYFLPDQCCLVATLQTGLSGRRNRGRMYLPATGLATLPSGQTPAATAQGLGMNLAALFTDLAGSSAGVPVVVSTMGGTTHPITSVKVDTKIDIQRRRANKQPATASTTAPVT